MESKWVQDIMNQQFMAGSFANPARLILATCLIKNHDDLRIKRQQVLQYMYRVFSDNYDIAKKHPNSIVRNIKKYGINDIKEVLQEALLDWDKYATNKVLVYDDVYIYLRLEKVTRSTLENTLQVIAMLYKKYFNCKLLEPKDINEDEVRDDKDMDNFGQGVYKNRVLEDLQYCPLCEETDTNKLFAVHILPSDYTDKISDLISKSNGLIMCRKHANDYLQKKFCFNNRGYVTSSKVGIMDERIHLCFNILTDERKKYIEEYYKILQKTSNKD